MATQHRGQDTAHVSGAGRALGGPSHPKLCIVLRVELTQEGVCPPRDMVQEGSQLPPEGECGAQACRRSLRVALLDSSRLCPERGW